MKFFNTIAALAALTFTSSLMAAPVNINTASASEIASALHGIGLDKAQAIVDYRQTYGMFSRADEIVFVRGIGSSIFEKNKNDILVK